MNRRTFIASAAATAALAGAKAASAAPSMIDCNAYLGHNPFRESIFQAPEALAAKLSKQGVTQAWVGSFAALLNRDISFVNAQLVDQCAKLPLFTPVGSINPMLPTWQDDVKSCAEQHGMKIIRLHPNYHGYKLDDAVFGELIALATQLELAVQIVAQMEDERTQSPLVQAKPVDLKPLHGIAEKHPEARIMVLNASALMMTTVLRGAKVWLDMAMLEGVGGIENLLKSWPQDRLCFGSHAPFFYPESSTLKLQESELSDAQMQAVKHQSAAAFIGSV